MVKISTLLPPADDKDRIPLSSGMILKITNARVIKGTKWNTAQIDALSPKGTLMYFYTTSSVVTTQIEKILLIHTPSKKEPVECSVKEIQSSEHPELSYLSLVD